jgi:hypothetical protein
MRILIIAIGRSGGTILNKWLGLELGHKILNEPIWNKLSIDKNDIVVKYHIEEIQEITDIDLTNWDKIIGLTRADTYDTAISNYRAYQKNEWDCAYEISDEWVKENQLNINENEEKIIKKIELIKEIKEIGIFVTYEGIYNTKEDIQRIKDYIGITNTKYEYLLDNTNRLRNRKKRKKRKVI